MLGQLLPYHRETDGSVHVAAPLWLPGNIFLIDNAFMHLDQGPTCCKSGLHMITKQMDITLNGHWLTRCPIKMRRDPIYKEVVMIGG